MRKLALIFAMLLGLSASAQTITYVIAPAAHCGNPTGTVWPQLWCSPVPLTLAGESQPGAAMSLDANTDAEWIAFSSSNQLALIKTTTPISWAYFTLYGKQVAVPTEVIFTFTAEDDSFTGTADVRLACYVGKVGRYLYGTICATSGGTVIVNPEEE